ncbi:VOC family protein [Gordonia shandongensis]|uniref:VOC family protein n=1 Tax=Gordonia shandongensis TaxID=376351 RepID=UPI0003FDE5F5|nr:VOC family protein [Gordonia shandongensis]
MSLPVPDAEASRRAYELLLGSGSDALWTGSNAAVTIADTDGDVAVDLRVSDLDAAVDFAGRRGLRTQITDDRRAGLVDHRPFGVADDIAADGTTMLDHLVLTGGSVEQALALFGGRLGISLRLIRELGDGVAQLFFRTPTVVLEVVAGGGTDDWGLMGLAWRAPSIDGERDRLVAAGIDVSEVRAGRKPGTRVCTVREPAFGTGTLLIQQDGP